MSNTNYLNILRDVYQTENGYIYNEIVANEFTYEYLVIEPFITNAGVITNSYFTNDIDWDNLSEESMVLNVEELNQIDNLKSFIEEVA